ncbi:MAG: hypothetical protein ACPH03_01030 [Flavobacteriaceae bacterium]
MQSRFFSSFRFISAMLFLSTSIGCGSFQSASYYSDGIYNSDNVIVVRKSYPTQNTSAYSQYFDEKAKQYTWDDNQSDVVLSQVDSLQQGSTQNYRSNPNWGGGQKTTQIIIQNNGWNYGNPYWSYGNFFSPFDFYWNRPFNYYNSFYWNRHAWGFYSPFYSPYSPFYLNGYYYDPYFYGGGFAYQRPYYGQNQWNRHNRPKRSRVYNSTYRGQAPSTSISSRSSRSSTKKRTAMANRNNVWRGRFTKDLDVPNLVEGGRRSNHQKTIRESQSKEQRIGSYVDRVIRTYRNKGYNVDIIQNPRQSEYSDYGSRAVSNNTRSTSSERKQSDSRKANSNNTQRTYTKKSNSVSRPSYNRSSPSRSTYRRSSPTRSYNRSSTPQRSSSRSARKQ